MANPPWLNDPIVSQQSAGVGVTPLPESPSRQADRRRDDAAAGRDDTRTGIAVRGEQRDIRYREYDNTMKLRDAFDGLPAVKDYRIAIAQLAQGLKTENTPQGDLALIYAYAKIMDPGSVVREGEAAAVSGADTVAGQLAASLRKQLEGTGTFSPEARENLRQEMIRKVTELDRLYLAQRERFRADAEAFGIDPERVIGPNDGDRFRPLLEEYDRRNTGQSPPNALLAPRVIDYGNGTQAAPAGSTMGADPINPEYQAEYSAWVTQNLGRFTPEQYDAFRDSLDQKYNYDTGQDYTAEGARILKQFERGGSQNLNIPPTERPLSDEGLFGTRAFSEQARNDALNNPVGAGLASFLDMGGFGGVSALLPDQMAALGQAQPEGTAVGQVGGAITGTAGLGKLSAETIGRVAPRTLAGGPRAQFFRNTATDAAYGGIYGGVTEGDPLSGAAYGTVGSVAGQGGGAIVGRAASGVTSSPTVARLYEQGITPTLGQIFRGRAVDNGGRSFIAGAEDVTGNTGFAGSLVNSARGRALEDANRVAFNIGGRGTGTVTDIGEGGLSQLDALKDASFDRALDGVALPRTGFVQRAEDAMQMGEAADVARGRGDFGFIIDKQLSPILGGHTIGGKQLQDSLRLLHGAARDYRRGATGPSPDPASAHVADALDQTAGALTDFVGDYSPETLPRLNEANAIYRNLRVLDDAAWRGRNEGGVFTGAQLGDAMGANNRQFGQRGFMAQGNSPFYRLQQDMQAVLPNKVPPTGVNAAPALAMLGVASGAGGTATDNDWLKAAGLLGLAAIPYTRAGQKATAAALLGNPSATLPGGGEVTRQMIGRAIRNRMGLFGSGALPFALTE